MSEAAFVALGLHDFKRANDVGLLTRLSWPGVVAGVGKASYDL